MIEVTIRIRVDEDRVIEALDRLTMTGADVYERGTPEDWFRAYVAEKWCSQIAYANAALNAEVEVQ